MTETPSSNSIHPQPSWRAGARAVWLLLAGPEERLQDWSQGQVPLAWLWMGLYGVFCGLLLAWVWSVASIVFRWYSGLPFVHVAVIVAVVALSPMRRGLLALGQAFGGNTQAGQALAAAGSLIALALCLLCINPPDPDWPTGMVGWLRWSRPQALYRVLALMPIWGTWGMMAPMHFCRCGSGEQIPAAPPAAGEAAMVDAMRRRWPILGTALWMAMPLAATLWELNFLRGWVVLPALTALLVGGPGSILLCRWRFKALTGPAILAGGMATQFAFLLGYLAAKDLLITGG